MTAGSDAKRTTTGRRLQRLLAIIPWIAARDGPPVKEVCARFDVREAALLEDLGLVSLVGVHPFTPDELVEVVVEGGRVWVHYALAFSRPLRLSPEQGLALLAAGASLLAVPGSDPEGPLARGLGKLAATFGIEPDQALEVDLGAASHATLDLLRRALDDRRQVEIDYYSYGRDERTTRVVDPYRVAAEAGQWYLLAYCHRAGGERLFRVDRILGAKRLDAVVGVHPARPLAASTLYRAEPDDPRVVLELAPEARWVLDQYPLEEVEALPAGGWRVRMAISAQPWLERLLLRLGPGGRLVSVDPPLSLDAGAAAAEKVLARYRRRKGRRVPSPR